MLFAWATGGGGATSSRGAALQTDRFVGAAGCKSSSCHGGAGEKRSQYLTWVQQDFHSRAYAVLVSARSARMAESLSLSSAQTSARCTVCHSPLAAVASTRLTNTAQPDEGVSCESCHGAAELWLRGHTRKDWSYANRVAAGMRDSRSFYGRANACVACHQRLDPDLLAAGHPELFFELDGQSIAEPKHWRDDPASGPRAWLVGQAVAFREVSWGLSKMATPDPEELARWDALTWLLAKATAQHSPLFPVIAPPGAAAAHADFASAQAQADLLARRASTIPWNEQLTATLLGALARSEAEFRVAPATSAEPLFLRAKRLVLALDRLARTVAPPPPGAAVTPGMEVLFEDVRTRGEFQPARFAGDLAIFGKTINRTP